MPGQHSDILSDDMLSLYSYTLPMYLAKWPEVKMHNISTGKEQEVVGRHERMQKPDLQSGNQKHRQTGDKWVDNDSVRKAIIWGEEYTEGRRDGMEKSGQGEDNRQRQRETQRGWKQRKRERDEWRDRYRERRERPEIRGVVRGNMSSAAAISHSTSTYSMRYVFNSDLQ